ncbi:MAG: hypothetical protein PHI58_02555 [Candidatus Omnitrophica bacterium]|nr:hypothetical protein [Candidatus Omnitrophota bacterium]
MITINLLPPELKKEESSFKKINFDFKGKEKLFRDIAAAALIVLVSVHVLLFFIGLSSKAAVKARSQKLVKLAPGKKEYDALKNEALIANRKASAIDTLMANRFSWAQKLNSLSDSMIQGIWLTGLSYDEKQTEVSVQVTTAAAANGKKELSRIEKKKLNLRYLSISGYASSMGEQGAALVGKFIASMKDNPAFFSDLADIRLESIKTEKMFDQEVMSFKIICLFKK